MQEESLNQLLIEIIGSWGVGAKIAAKKLKTMSVTREMAMPEAVSFERIIQQLETCGELVTANEETGTAGVVMMSGAAEMNPAVLALKMEGSKVMVKVYAKEGLIKQHTAEKAMKRVVSALTFTTEGSQI